MSSFSQLIQETKRSKSHCILEGVEVLYNAWQAGAELEEMFIYADSNTLTHKEFSLDFISFLQTKAIHITEKELKDIFPNPKPPQCFARARIPDYNQIKPSAEGVSIYLENISLENNLGDIIRTSCAAGVSAVYVKTHLNIWSSLALRCSRGFHFSIPVIKVQEIPDIQPLIAIETGGQPISKTSLPKQGLIAFGGERRGLSEEILKKANQIYSFEMQNNVPSLNVASTVAAILF